MILLFGAGPCPKTIKNAKQRLHFVEQFSGDQHLSAGMRMFGYVGLSSDKRYHAMHDFLTSAGFLLILGAVWRLVPGGVLHLAPPCSNFIVTSMGSTGRRPDNPEGNARHASVRINNRLVSRLCHVLWLANKRGVHWMVEQPDSSVMFKHKRFNFFWLEAMCFAFLYLAYFFSVLTCCCWPKHSVVV